MRKTISLITFVFLICNSAWATGVRLPIHTLRDQDGTAHCWAYATSHMLESRALLRDSIEAMIDIEKDIKYWVDYERMLSLYRLKTDIYIDYYEGAWQIEYWEAFLKHGRPLVKTLSTTPEIRYPILAPYYSQIDFSAGPPYVNDPTRPSLEEVKTKLKDGTFATEDEAKAYITNYLDRWYDKATFTTTWLDTPVNTEEVPKLLLGEDFGQGLITASFVLIKPVTDGNFGWAKYLGERYWGYRYDSTKVIDLIIHSLDDSWPVTFDNVYHAMTIVGYEHKNSETYFAVADSVGARIIWYSSHDLQSALNLVTFFRPTIEELLPSQTKTRVSGIEDMDARDNLKHPPGE